MEVEQAAKVALQAAQSKSWGTYVGRISHFDNLIIPVLPYK